MSSNVQAKTIMSLLPRSSSQNSNLMNHETTITDSNKPEGIFMEKALNMKNLHIQELMKQLKETKSTYQKLKENLMEENSRLQQENLKLKEKVQGMEKKVHIYQREILGLNEQNQLMSCQIHKLNSSLQETDQRKQTQYQKVISELQKSSIRVKELELQNKEWQLSKLKLNEEIAAAKQKHEQFVRMHEQQIALKSKQVEALTLTNGELVTKVSKLTNKKHGDQLYLKKLTKIEEKVYDIMSAI